MLILNVGQQFFFKKGGRRHMRVSRSLYRRLEFFPVFMLVILVSLLITPALFSSQTADAAAGIQLKWKAAVPGGGLGFVVGDVNKDGAQEVVWASSDRCVALKGTDGSMVWNVSVPGAKSTTQPQLADLKEDGYLEVVVPIQGPTSGFYILSGRDGSIQQSVTKVKLASGASVPFNGLSLGGPVIAPVDAGDYPTVFFAAMGFVTIDDDSNSTGFLVSYKYNATTKTYVQLNYTRIWHPCSGGLSIADTDYDGELELYMNDRNMYTDRGYGGGVVSFWARNLTKRWSVPDLMVSSNKPMLADVDGDGILDVIVTPMTGGLAVLNSRDGSVLTTGGKYRKNITIVTQWGPISGHYQCSVCDLQGNGHLDVLMSDGYGALEDTGHDITLDTVIWDLTGWQELARIPGNLVGRCYYSPQEGDVTGDGIMDIVVANYSRVFVFDGSHDPTSDHTYPLVWMSQNLTGRLMYPVIADVDGDGYNEIAVASQGRWVHCFDTPTTAASPGPRTVAEFSSERRLGVAQYVPPPFATPEPIVSGPSPANWAQLVPITTSQLSFNLADYQNNTMSYTVTTSPNIGGGSGSGKPNGRYAVNISSLKYSTTYVWRVNVTDGSHRTIMSYVFVTAPTPTTNKPPTQSAPTLKSTKGANKQGDNFTAYNQSTSDVDGDSVSNVYHWYKNGVSTTNLQYSFDTANSTDVQDYSGYGNNGKTVYNVTWTPNGRVGGAYNFNGGYITVPDSNTLDGNYQWYEMSAEVWVKFSADQHGDRVLFKQPSYQIGFENYPYNTVYAGIWTLMPNPDTSAGGLVSNYIEAKNPNTLSKNTWHQVAFTYKYLQGLRLYVDGALVASSKNSAKDFGFIERGVQPLYIGWFDYYRGMIDEVNIYPKCLSAQQISQDYLQTKNGQSSSSTIVSEETTSGDQLKCVVIPNDGHTDGKAQSTPTVIVQSAAVNIQTGSAGTENPPLGNYSYDENTSATVNTLAPFLRTTYYRYSRAYFNQSEKKLTANISCKAAGRIIENIHGTVCQVSRRFSFTAWLYRLESAKA
jgi:hypothetical protein